MQISLGWKIVVPGRPHGILDRSVCFERKASRSIYAQFDVPINRRIETHALIPARPFHQAVFSAFCRLHESRPAERKFKSLPYKILHGNQTTCIQMKCRQYSSGLLCATFRLDPLNINSSCLIDAIDLGDVQAHSELRNLISSAIGAWTCTRPKKVRPTKFPPPFPFTEFVLDDNVDAIEFIEANKKLLVGILIGRPDWEHLTETIVQRVLEKCDEFNLKNRRGKLLADKQGLLHVRREDGPGWGDLSKASDLAELAFVFSRILDAHEIIRTESQQIAQDCQETISEWVQRPETILGRGKNGRRIITIEQLWRCLATEFGLSGAVMGRSSGTFFPPQPYESNANRWVTIIPLAQFKKTREAWQKLADQINGSYNIGHYDAAAVMCRRLLESLLIAAFEAKGLASAIKNKDSTYLMLGEIILKAKSGKHIGELGRDKETLDPIKKLGDIAAHHPYTISTKEDVEIIGVNLRRIVSRLLEIIGGAK